MIFDVALWRYWPSLMPDCCDYIEAATSFAAVEFLMQRCRMPYAARVSARAIDGSLIYRGFGVDVLVTVCDRRQAEEEVGTDG